MARVWSGLGLLLVALILIAPGWQASSAAQTSTPVRWTEFNVDLDVLPDGTVHVTETQVIRFDGGPYRNGYADIPLARVDDISNFVVSEINADGTVTVYDQVRSSSITDPGTYSAVEQDGTLLVDFHFPPAEDETRTFVLEYDVTGAIRVYENLDPPNLQLWWTAIAADTTEVAPVDSATVTVTLPEAVDPAEVVILTADGTVATDPDSYTDDGRTFTWHAEDLDNGDELEVRIQFPIILQTDVPSWQAADDARRETAEKEAEQEALYNLIFGGIGILLAVAGALILYGLWYTKGRDPQVGLIAEFLPEPPDDSPPGTVGVLVDEQADQRDLVATLVDLGRRGVFRIEDKPGGARPDLNVTLLDPGASMSSLEQSFAQDLFDNDLTKDRTVSIGEGSLSNPQAVLKSLYDDLVARGYYTRSPEVTRSSYRQRGTVLVVISFILFCFVVSQIQATLLFLPFLVVGILGMILRWQSRHMPKRTEAGAEAAAKWRAFRVYLTDIQKYEKLEESTAIFDKYLPYAIAFGIDKSWVDKFARANSPIPTWMGPGGTVIVVNQPGRRSQPSQSGGSPWIDMLDTALGDLTRSSGGSGSRGDSGGGGGLQERSDRTARSLQDSSDSLVDMLNSAGRAFGSFGGGSSSRRSTGSFGSFGGGGGRRGGFSGGGSRRGSSGGGRRGFG